MVAPHRDYFKQRGDPNRILHSLHGQLCSTGGPDWVYKGKQSVYRFHIEDPIHFREAIRVTIEHGHANENSHDYSSTAYWYQTEPHAPPPKLPGVVERLPRA